MLLAGVSLAGFESWTNKDGKTAELELVNVSDKDGEKAGEFKLRSGATVTLKASELSDESAAKLNEWQPPTAAAEAKASVFDDILDGNLERLDGKRLKKCDDATKPAKYYVFYYTASWCGPCQQFTPSLVDWYEKNKNDNFELVLITSDSDEKAMENYAAEKKMPWPQLKHRKAKDFKKDFKHGVTGIPSVIVCDLEGKNLGNFRSNLPGITALVKD
jgi:nucleoredoxin